MPQPRKKKSEYVEDDKTPEVIGSITTMLGNPATRLILRGISGRCKKCKKNRLEKALELYSGASATIKTNDDIAKIKVNKNIEACLGCQMASKIVSLALNQGAKRFGLEIDGDVISYLRVKHVQRGMASVIKGIAEHGVKRPQTLHAPFLVVWDYTNRCNLKCKHCYANANEKLGDELSTEERYKIVDQLDDAGIVAIAVSGGEPLMREDFWEVISYAEKKGIYISIASNGMLITKDVAKRLAKFVGYAEISLDGKPAIHDNFRNKKGAFKAALQGMKNCVEAGIVTCMATTVTRANYNDIPFLIKTAKKLGVLRFIAFNFIPAGRGKEIINMDITPQQREKLLNYLAKELEGGYEAFTTAPQFSRITMERQSKGHNSPLSPTHFADA
ncbi:MAG: radical SAM protein, partial [Candidatus Aenigmatarchaeota archaeon]